jgi:uncharacterized membrane protein YccF (DUF307 family)
MRFVLNVIWLIFGGFWLAILYTLAGVLACILIITIPFGIQAFKMAVFALWPFGRTLVKRPGAGAPSAIGNVIWLILFGWWLALGHVITAIAQAITIIGLPLAAANVKLIPVSLWPMGRKIVRIDDLAALESYRAQGYETHAVGPARREPPP